MIQTLIIIGSFPLLVGLFYLLGKIADTIVDSVRRLSATFRVSIFFVGIVLSFFTSLPEILISANALITHIPDVSIGNLLGSVMVIFGLIFGCSVVLHHTIRTDGKLSRFLPVLAYLFLPFILGLDGTISRPEGVLLIFWYALLMYFLYREHRRDRTTPAHADQGVSKDITTVCIAMTAMLLISHLIIQITGYVLDTFHIQGFAVGLIFFALGTNIPEITVMIRAWKNNMRELSTSHLIGSTIFDPLLIGVFAFLRPYHFDVGLSYINLMVFTFLLILVLAVSYRTEKKFSRQEGLLLLMLYIAFLSSEIGIAVAKN